MLIAVDRIHPLWHSPFLPAFFLVSAIAIGYPMVVIESTFSARTFNQKPEIKLLAKLTKITPYVLGVYIALKLFDLAFYGEFALLFSGWGLLFIAENLLLAIIPFFMLLKESVRKSKSMLFNVSLMMVAGLILNRFNTYLITYSPRPGFDYFPSIGEFVITAMMIAIVFVGYKLLANYFPVLPSEQHS
jgi:Ni/Fe-hydrogenase subunit HybB-like protein